MIRFISGLLDRLFIVLGALVFSQTPQFFSQYTHRLSGHLEEIRIHVSLIQQTALRSGKTLQEYIFKFSNNADLDLHFQGEMMQNMVLRHQEHSQAMLALAEATPLSRPFIFLKYFNLEIFKGTLAHFQPGLIFNLEGLVYALVGMGVGFSSFWLLKIVCSFISKKRFQKKKQIS